MIVSFDDFKRESRIPNLYTSVGVDDDVHSAIQNKVMEFIQYYEPVYLIQFLESEENIKELYDYNELEDYQKEDEEKDNLIKSLKLAISNFVAFHYFRNDTVSNTGIGGVIPQGENSTRVNNIDRMVYLWNQMVYAGREAYIRFFGDKYPNSEIFKTINAFGI